MALSMAKTTIVIKDTTTTLFVSNLFFITLVGGLISLLASLSTFHLFRRNWAAIAVEGGRP